MAWNRAGRVWGAWALALLASGPVAARAQATPAAPTLDQVLEDVQLKARLTPAPAFVDSSRAPRPSGFIPVGQAHPARPTKVMTPAELAAATADLDAARERQQRRAGQTPAVVPLKKPKSAAPAKTTVR